MMSLILLICAIVLLVLSLRTREARPRFFVNVGWLVLSFTFCLTNVIANRLGMAAVFGLMGAWYAYSVHVLLPLAFPDENENTPSQ